MGLLHALSVLMLIIGVVVSYETDKLIYLLWFGAPFFFFLLYKIIARG